MASRSYRIELILQTAAICATIYLFFFLLFETRFVLTTILVGFASAAQCALLVVSVDRRNRVLARFFEALRSADFSRSPAFPADPSFAALKTEYAATIDALRRRRLEGERQRRYAEIIAESAGVGFAVIDAAGRVDFSNEAFNAMLGCRAVKKLSDLEGLRVGFVERLGALKNGEKTSLRFERGPARGDEPLDLLVTARDFVLLGEKYRLLSLQNIRSELETVEMEAWQGLARTLMHEIMNSLAPISSLAFSATAILGKILGRDGPKGRELSEEETDAMRAIETIGKRSRSLLAFVDNYRKVSRLPVPVFSLLRCEELFGKVRSLMEGALHEGKIALRLSVVPSGLRLSADEGLIEQLLINLAKNSIEALAATPRPLIDMSARLEPGGRPLIEVADNGKGIPEADLERVFIPFFTTKSEGSGVGLSLCRQIMSLHGGSITVSSAPGERTVFRLRF